MNPSVRNATYLGRLSSTGGASDAGPGTVLSVGDTVVLSGRSEVLDPDVEVVVLAAIGFAAVVAPEDYRRSLEILRTTKSDFEALVHPREAAELPAEVRRGSLADKVEVCRRHFASYLELKGERKAVFSFRKFYGGYLKGFVGANETRRGLMKINEGAAVLAARGPVCVLAGAGTGKTRTITRRMQNLV